MSAENVWTCIGAYRTAAARAIEGKYHNSLAAILARLGSYSGISKYHGHRSGTAGGPESPEATINLDNAIAHLNAGTYTAPVTGPRAVNTELKAASVAGTEALLTIVRTESDLGKILKALDLASPSWESNKNVWNAYNLKYFNKKGKNASKRL
jgi:hypothetical protein